MTAVFQGLAKSTNPNIWYVPIGLMFVPAIICLVGTPFAVGKWLSLCKDAVGVLMMLET